MQYDFIDAEERKKCFAKLLTYKGRQILVYLYRCDGDHLVLVMQLWVGRTDEQLRIEINVPDDDEGIYSIFQKTCDENIETFLDETGVSALLEEVERQQD
jgi:hypothetical protein